MTDTERIDALRAAIDQVQQTRLAYQTAVLRLRLLTAAAHDEAQSSEASIPAQGKNTGPENIVCRQ